MGKEAEPVNVKLQIKRLRYTMIGIGIVFLIFNILFVYSYSWKIPAYLLVVMFLYNLQKHYSEILLRMRKMQQAEALVMSMQGNIEQQTDANILHAKELLEDIKRMRRKEF